MDASEKRAATRKAVRKHIHRYGQPRDHKPHARDIMAEAEGSDGWEKASWLKAQKSALELQEKMDTLISRSFVAQRLAELGRIVRDVLQRLPARLAHQFASERSAETIRATLEKEIDGALTGLANVLDRRATEPELDVKREMRKGNRGVKRARAVELQ